MYIGSWEGVGGRRPAQPTIGPSKRTDRICKLRAVLMPCHELSPIFRVRCFDTRWAALWRHQPMGVGRRGRGSGHEVDIPQNSPVLRPRRLQHSSAPLAALWLSARQQSTWIYLLLISGFLSPLPHPSIHPTHHRFTDSQKPPTPPPGNPFLANSFELLILSGRAHMLQHFRCKNDILSAAEDFRYHRSTFGILLLTISVRAIKIDNYVGLILSAVKIDICGGRREIFYGHSSARLYNSHKILIIILCGEGQGDRNGGIQWI